MVRDRGLLDRLRQNHEHAAWELHMLFLYSFNHCKKRHGLAQSSSVDVKNV